MAGRMSMGWGFSNEGSDDGGDVLAGMLAIVALVGAVVYFLVPAAPEHKPATPTCACPCVCPAPTDVDTSAMPADVEAQ